MVTTATADLPAYGTWPARHSHMHMPKENTSQLSVYLVGHGHHTKDENIALRGRVLSRTFHRAGSQELPTVQTQHASKPRT